MAGLARLTVTIEPASYALINRVCATLTERGLDDVIEAMTDAGVFREHMVIRNGPRGLVLGLGPMTELLLIEFEAIAIRRWSDDAKRMAMQHTAQLAGFAE